MANFAFAMKRALWHLRLEIGKQTFTLGTNYFRLPGVGLGVFTNWLLVASG
jgi:hypothetical protein